MKKVEKNQGQTGQAPRPKFAPETFYPHMEVSVLVYKYDLCYLAGRIKDEKNLGRKKSGILGLLQEVIHNK